MNFKNFFNLKNEFNFLHFGVAYHQYRNRKLRVGLSCFFFFGEFFGEAYLKQNKKRKKASRLLLKKKMLINK